MTGESERRRKGRGGDAGKRETQERERGKRRFRKEKKRKWKEKKEGRKERNAKEKERKKEEKERKEGKGDVGRLDLAGGGRSWPEWVDKAPKERVDSGASVVQYGEMEFCKRCFGGRTYSSLERE